MTQYRVYLPPPILPSLLLLPCSASAPTPSSSKTDPTSNHPPDHLLRFHKLNRSGDGRKSPETDGAKDGRMGEVGIGAVESWERSTILGKRAAGSDRDVNDCEGERGNTGDGGGDAVAMTAIGAGVGGAGGGAGAGGNGAGERAGESLTRQEVHAPATAVHGHDDQGAGNRSTKEDTSRRRSRRITRQSASLLDDALPRYDLSPMYSESSLNTTTTTSHPSQFPPTQNENDISVSHLPTWHIPLTRLTNLHCLVSTPTPARTPRRYGPGREKGLHTLIVCVVMVDQPILRKRKEEKQHGQEGTLWIGRWTVVAPPPAILIPGGITTNLGGVGDVSCGVKLWDECARDWGDDKVRRGDVVLVENIEYKHATNIESSHLILTPHNAPKITILFRTVPRYATFSKTDYLYRQQSHPAGGVRKGAPEDGEKGRSMLPEDRAVRPDLRLGRSDAGIRKVGEIVRWFAEWVGGEGAV
ncbi:hypothetical protein IAR55_003389 [Kwoniella newhampshirensis]|uniref:Uncharacterized protein n=1 Tax=Kwoniella newhampshirensis TaxID=1651941 RepID=A0AAW0YZB3_9TREE